MTDDYTDDSPSIEEELEYYKRYSAELTADNAALRAQLAEKEREVEASKSKIQLMENADLTEIRELQDQLNAALAKNEELSQTLREERNLGDTLAQALVGNHNIEDALKRYRAALHDQADFEPLPQPPEGER